MNFNTPKLTLPSVACALAWAWIPTAFAIHLGTPTQNTHLAVGAMRVWVSDVSMMRNCSLVRISKTHALTVAHCVREQMSEKALENMMVWVRFPDQTEELPVTKITLLSPRLDQELALLELNPKHHSINYIETASENFQPQIGQGLLAVGFGVTDNQWPSKVPSLFDDVPMPTQRLATLFYTSKKIYSKSDAISDTIPVGTEFPFWKFKRTSISSPMICEGDSGSPLLHKVNSKLKVIGLASHVQDAQDCEGNPLGYYIPTFPHHQWIQENIK
jgi:hypothetical protein